MTRQRAVSNSHAEEPVQSMFSARYEFIAKLDDHRPEQFIHFILRECQTQQCFDVAFDCLLPRGSSELCAISVETVLKIRYIPAKTLAHTLFHLVLDTIYINVDL